ncbi:MAG: HRDC domain-containing protein [Saprospiraceae bacterium]|nr:HRDC domain-containing protein [Saprospiraceae bacterium]
MQIKLFTIPIPGGEALTEDMNVFLRSQKVLEVTEQVVGNHWCFCIKYLDDAAPNDRQKIDYREVLDPETFQRFSRMREVRKALAESESVKPYVIFTDAELAELAKLEQLTLESMQRVKGIGEKKTEKYGAKFIEQVAGKK